MKTIQQIRDEVAKEYPGEECDEINEIAKRYAVQAIKECAERARANDNGPSTTVNKNSILEIINELK